MQGSNFKFSLSFCSVKRYESLQIYLYSGPLAKFKMADFKGIHIVQWIDELKTQVTVKFKKKKEFFKRIEIFTYYFTT